MKPVLRVENLSYATPLGRPLQSGLTLSVSSGQLLLISGTNGSGKSTFLRILMKEIMPKAGTFRCSIPLEQVEYLPQLENMEVHFPLTLKEVLSISQTGPISWDAVDAIGLLDREQLNTAWNAASGGERKRALLTRTLLRGPSLLVLDEPLNHLDKSSRTAMSKVLAEFLLGASETSPRAVVMVCHQGLENVERELFDIVNLNLEKTIGSDGTKC